MPAARRSRPAPRGDDFPEWRRRDLVTTRPDLGFALLAADGATTASLLDVQLVRLESAGARTPDRHPHDRRQRRAGRLR